MSIILGVILPIVLLLCALYLVGTYRTGELIKWVGVAVEAAEQIYKSGQGKEKFDYVFTWISKKFKIDQAELKNLIESAVYKINRDKR